VRRPDSLDAEVIARTPALPAATLYPKERALLDLVRHEHARERRVLAYLTHTERRDLSPRPRAVLEPHGLRVAELKADTASADRREAGVAARVRQGADVLIGHPRLVQTGLDYEASDALSSAAADAPRHSPSSSRSHLPSAASSSRSASSTVG
jgi:hypothetical protein